MISRAWALPFFSGVQFLCFPWPGVAPFEVRLIARKGISKTRHHTRTFGLALMGSRLYLNLPVNARPFPPVALKSRAAFTYG